MQCSCADIGGASRKRTGAPHQSGARVSYSAAYHGVTPATALLTVPELINLSVPVRPRGAAGGTRQLRGFVASAGIGSKESSDAAGPAHRPERTRNGAAEMSARTHKHMRWTPGYPSQCALPGLEATVWPRACIGRRYAWAGVPLTLIRGLACEQQTVTC
jgi:hypothetical protein